MDSELRMNLSNSRELTLRRLAYDAFCFRLRALLRPQIFAKLAAQGNFLIQVFRDGSVFIREFMTAERHREAPSAGAIVLSLALSAMLLASGLVGAQVQAGAAAAAMVIKEDAEVLRVQLETPVGALAQVTLLQGARPALRMQLQGMTLAEAQELVKQLVPVSKIRQTQVVPGLDGRILIEVVLNKHMQVLDETVVALDGGRSRWELVLADGQAPQPQPAPLPPAALSELRFDTRGDRLDVVLEGSAGLVAEVSFDEGPSRLVVELPGVTRARLDELVARIDNLPPLFRRASVPQTGSSRIVFDLRGGADLVDIGGVANGSSGQVSFSLVPDQVPVPSKGALQSIQTAVVDGELTLQLAGALQAKVNTFTLEQPSRLVMDFLGWSPQQVRQAVEQFKSGHPAVRQAAVTETRLGSARVVFDLVSSVDLGARRYPLSDDQGRMSVALKAPRSTPSASQGLAVALGRDLGDLRKPEVIIRPVQLEGRYASEGSAQTVSPARYNMQTMLEQALQADARYLASKADFEAVSEAVPQARAGYLPVASFDYQRSNVHQNVRQTPNPTFLANSTSYPSQTLSVTITQPLIRPQNWVRMDQAKITTEQARLNLLASEQDLIVRVSTSYLGLLASLDAQSLAQAERDATAKQLELARSRLQNGLGTITQLHDTTARYAVTEAKVIEASNRVDDARLALKEILGEDVDVKGGFKRDFVAVAPKPANPDSWVAAALDQNLALQARKMARDIAELEIKRQRAGHLPTLDLVGSATRQDADGSLYGGGQKTDTGEVAFKLKVPLYEGGLTSSLVREAVARSGKADREMDQESRKTERVARSAYLAVQSNVQTLEALRQSVVAQESALESKLEGYRNGLQTVVTVVDAQRLYFAARRDYLQARYDYLINRLKLKQAVGTLSRSDLQDLTVLMD